MLDTGYDWLKLCQAAIKIGHAIVGKEQFIFLTSES